MRKKICINEGWSFSKSDLKGLSALFGKKEAVNLPHTWNTLDGQDGGNDYIRGAFRYTKELAVNISADEAAYIEFRGVNSICEVFAGNKLVTRHEGGFSTFRADITPYIKHGKVQLSVTADNSENDRIYPQSADFTFFGGIYRDVNLITVNKAHFDLDYFGTCGIKITPRVNADGSADTELTAYPVNAGEYRVEFYIEDAAIPADASGKAVWHTDSPHLWNGRTDPFLYAVTAKLLSKDGTVIDEITQSFGIRSFSITPDGGFFLNGKSYPLHGVARHQDRENMGWAITLKEHEEDMRLIAEVGANTIRLAHYQHSPDFYDLCDRYGMIVWAEIPFISAFMTGDAARENTLSQMRELVLQNYNRPSIVCWGIANEITIGSESPELLENLETLNSLCHALDSTRLTTIANLTLTENASPCNRITDIISYNHYFGWYMGSVADNGPWIDKFHAENPDICLGISEYGAEAVLKYHSDTPQVQDYTEEYQAYYHEQMLKTFEQRPYLWSTHVWNMFDFASDMRDEGGTKGRNNKGLVTYDRKTRKDSFYLYKAYWSDEPFVHICSKRFKNRATNTITVKVYSNQPSVSLTLNGSPVATLTGEKIFVFDEIPLAPGENAVSAFSGELTDRAVFTKIAEPDSSYVLEGVNVGKGVSNWFEGISSEGTLEFPDGYFSIRDTLGDIMKVPEGEKFVNGIMDRAMEEMGMKVSRSMLAMAKSFTIEKIFTLAGTRIPAGTDIQVNKILNGIKKP